MPENLTKSRQQGLRIALVVFGAAFLLIYPLMIVWPSGWAWQPSQHEYEQMIVGICATLGVLTPRGVSVHTVRSVT